MKSKCSLVCAIISGFVFICCLVSGIGYLMCAESVAATLQLLTAVFNLVLIALNIKLYKVNSDKTKT